MKKFLKFSSYLVLSALTIFGFTSCDDDGTDDSIDPNQEILKRTVSQYVTNTVIVTYKSLADETIGLYEALAELKANKTAENVQKAINKWIVARNYWELSEAFLFGAVADFGIDPHIDTWPLDKSALISLLNNASLMANLAKEGGDEWAGNSLEDGLLGFHGIEYILFEEGRAKDVSKISTSELVYAVAVSGDLRNQCIRLEASWAGIEKITSVKKEKLLKMGVSTTFENTKYSYGESMCTPGLTSFVNSYTDANETIIEGCITIADEVGAMKIGKPHNGEDVNYIESPYSYNSKVDFIGNINSIKNAYLGGTDTNKRGASVSDFIKVKDAALDTRIKNAIDNAISKIEAIPYPFAKNYTSSQAGQAVEACTKLATILEEAKIVLRK